MQKFPSSKDILLEAIQNQPYANINKLHSITFKIMKKYRDIYYPKKVDDLLSRPSFNTTGQETKKLIKDELLKPIKVTLKNKTKTYANFMEESARRISQTFQSISGNLAELCAEKFLIDVGLKDKVHYTRKTNHTDLTFYHPSTQNSQRVHRVEIKNVKLRERGVRGLAFDGDSLLGFFDQVSEFTSETIKLIYKHCQKTGGYCYVPPKLTNTIRNKIANKRFKSNEDFASDMKRFVESGSI